MLLTNKTIILKLFFVIIFAFSIQHSFAQCFEIESILVDACGPGSLEGENEMIRFKVGSIPLDASTISASWPTANSWLGICQNAASANATAALNATITACGYLLEPSEGIIPANSCVLFLTSTDINITANSFANLNDTLFVIYQCVGNSLGHFSNNISSGIKTFSMSFSSPAGCSDAVTYNNAFLTGGNGAMVNFTPSGSTTYDNNGCQAPFVQNTININETGFSICPGDSINLSAMVVGNVTSATWSGGNGSFSSINNTTTSYYSNITDNTDFYIYIVGQTNCGIPSKDSVLVDIGDNISSVNITSPSTILCQGDSILLTANGTGNYLWSTGSTDNSIFVSTANTYSVTSTSSCGSATDNIIITTASPTTVAITEPDTTICQGENITLYASGATSYLWNNGDTTNSITVSATGNYFVTTNDGCSSNTDSVQVNVIPQITVSIIEPDVNNICLGESIVLHAVGSGLFLWNTGAMTDSIITLTEGSFFVTSANSCFIVSDTVQVNIIPPTTISISESDTIICQGETVTFHVNGSSSYLWNTGATTDSIIVTTAGNYSVSANSTCPSNMDTVQVNVIPQPAVFILEPDTNYICSDQSITLHANGVGSFIWNTGATTDSIVISTTGSFFVTSANSCFMVSDTVHVNVIPPTTITITEPDTTICEGQSIIFHANGATSYLWNTGATSNTITVSLAGNYFVTSNGACPSNTDTIQVNIIPQITVSIEEGNYATLCPSIPLTLNAIGGTNYVWSTGELTNSIIVNSIGDYTVETTNGSCPSGFATITIVPETPPSVIIIGDSIFCSEKSLTLIASGTGSFYWSTGEVGNSTAITFAQQVILTSVDQCGNIASDTINVKEKDCRTTVFIPNTFTPDNNGINELFNIKGSNIESFDGKIFNRWGELLFEWDNLNGGWDGTYKGSLVQEDTYVYRIHVRFIDNINENYIGGILLIK